MRRFGGGVRAVAIAGLVAASLPGTAGAAIHPHPDLRVSAGSVSAANGTLKGSFVVSNKGTARAAASSAALIIWASRQDHEVKRFRLPSLGPPGMGTVKVAVAVPSSQPTGSLSVRACADRPGKVRESSERNNCRSLGTIQVGVGKTGPTAPNATMPASLGVIDPGGLPPSTVPSDPIPFTKGVPFRLDSSESSYWVFIPDSYDATHATPTTLFVWLHGCGGLSSGDIYTVSPGGSQDWISVAVGGRDGQCWDPDSDQSKVRAAIADVKTHFNVNPRRVILGGYSSGGDLAYRTAFYDAGSFAGLLIVNSSPFRDTGSSQTASLAAAAWKFHVVHLAHLQDTTYPIAGVRSETDAMVAAGFPIARVEVDGGHFDDAGAFENEHAVPGTNADITTYLLPHIDDGWLSP